MLTFSVLKIDKYSIFMNRKFRHKALRQQSHEQSDLRRGFTTLEISYKIL